MTVCSEEWQTLRLKRDVRCLGDFTRPTMAVYYRRFETTYRSCRQLSNCLAIEDGTVRLFEMSARNCHPRLRNIPEERASQLYRGGTLTSRNAKKKL